MNELKQKYQYIDLISSELKTNDIIKVYHIDAGEFSDPEAPRFNRTDYFVDNINGEGYPVTIWELKNGKNN